MWKLQISRFVSAVLLSFLLLANLAFAVGVCNGFAKGGVDGIKRWINHITYEGRDFSEPVVKHVYLRFVLDWLFIAALTLICLHAIRLCTRKIRALEAKDSPSS